MKVCCMVFIHIINTEKQSPILCHIPVYTYYKIINFYNQFTVAIQQLKDPIEFMHQKKYCTYNRN